VNVVVIKVKKDGKVKYVKSASFFDSDHLVDHPHQAQDFSNREAHVGFTLSNINYPGHSGARSGIEIDEAPVIVKVKITATEIEVLPLPAE
jgi:hypothetical protein